MGCCALGRPSNGLRPDLASIDLGKPRRWTSQIARHHFSPTTVCIVDALGAAAHVDHARRCSVPCVQSAPTVGRATSPGNRVAEPMLSSWWLKRGSRSECSRPIGYNPMCTLTMLSWCVWCPRRHWLCCFAGRDADWHWTSTMAPR